MPVHDQFLTLLTANQRPLMKVCWVYTSNTHDRDDLLQEITSHLWSAFPRYDRSRPFSTWMYRVALNVAIDFQRRKKRWGRTATGLDEGSVPSNDNTDKQEQLDEVRELLQQHNDADRAMLLLHLEGHSYSEIGDVLGISETNVGTRLNRLKSELRHTVQSASEGA